MKYQFTISYCKKGCWNSLLTAVGHPWLAPSTSYQSLHITRVCHLKNFFWMLLRALYLNARSISGPRLPWVILSYLGARRHSWGWGRARRTSGNRECAWLYTRLSNHFWADSWKMAKPWCSLEPRYPLSLTVINRGENRENRENREENRGVNREVNFDFLKSWIVQKRGAKSWVTVLWNPTQL